MKRLLCLASNMNSGGAETFLMKVYRNLDRAKYQMDFCINVPEKCFYEDEILGMGGRVFRIPAKSQNRSAFSEQLAEIVKQNRYDYVLRITSNAAGFMDLKIAKQAGARVCAVRSSNSSDGSSLISWIVHMLGRMMYTRYVDVKFAPSDLAAKYTFGEKAYRSGEVTILHNAVDLNVFHYDAEGRAAIREGFGIPDDTLVVGHVGRFMAQKNHGFLLKIFSEISKRRPDSKLLLIGSGNLEQELRTQAAELGLTDQVIFAGIRSDIPQILSAMDIFVFPSLFEGMPNAVIEAQATGLPCFISDTITKEADITGLVQYLSLSDSAETWANAALTALHMERKDTKQDFVRNQYDIQSTVDQFVKLCFQE